MTDRWVTTEEAAQHISLAVSTLEKARLKPSTADLMDWVGLSTGRGGMFLRH